MFFTLKALFITEINKFLFSVFSHVRKRLDKKAKVNFKIYDVAKWKTNSRSMKFGQLMDYNIRIIFS